MRMWSGSLRVLPRPFARCTRLMKRQLTSRRAGLLFLTLMAVALARMTAAGADGPGDFWLRHYGLPNWAWDFDQDGDGFTTRVEYEFGTDPKTASSRPPAVTAERQGTLMTLSWTSRIGARYQVGRSAELDGWNVGPALTGNGGTLSVSIPMAETQDFFRLRAVQPDDADGDGLSSVEEAILGTNPGLADTDGDGLSDGREVLVTMTNPLVADPEGGSISGKVSTDPNGDGDVADGGPVSGAEVFLDLDFDGRLGADEPRVQTGVDGSFNFSRLRPGAYHVRQVLATGQLQTLPAPGASPVLNRLPDQVVGYTDGVDGAMAGPHGILADPAAIVPQIAFRPVVSVDPSILLKPIGLRGVLPPIAVWSYNEFMILPRDASVLLRFDEVIVDRAGPDLVIHTITQGIGEEARLELGLTPETLVNAGTITEQLGALTTSIPIDLQAVGVTGAVQYARITSLTNAGSAVGFELVGAEAIHFAPPAAEARLVVVTGTEAHPGQDFARHFRDDPPNVFLAVSGGDFRAGSTAVVTVQADDDVAVAARTLTANGVAVSLDSAGRGSVPLVAAGTVTLVATAVDSAGQAATNRGTLYVNNADGSSPFNPNLTGAAAGAGYLLRFVTPAAGAILETNIPVVATIEGLETPQWTLEYAPIDRIDPYQLDAPDPDWVVFGSGSGFLQNQPAGVFPGGSVSNGVYFLRLSATPASGGATTCSGQVVAKGVVREEIEPRVVITSPGQGAAVSLTADIRGSIQSARPLKEWYAEYAPAAEVDVNNLGASGPGWTRFASGTNTVDNNLIARFDASLVRDGSYLVRVVAWNDLRLGWAEPLPLEVVNGGFKPGRLRREFTDLNLSVGGIPFVIRRIYDSLDATRDQGLGFGWSLAFFNPSINETVAQTGVGLFGATPFREGTRVYLNTPDGRRIGFTFHAEPVLASFLGTAYRAVFNPDPGVYETLETPEGSDPFLAIDRDGNAAHFFLGFAWNPSVYILTTRDGVRYTYDQAAGFVDARDLSGNTLTATPEGLRHSNGAAVKFVRDARNRLVRILAPDGVTVDYAYDSTGDLTSVTDDDGRVTGLTYYSEPAHYLKSVTDPLGRVGTSYEYDAAGRLVATVDADGKRSLQAWDPAGFTGTITDRNGRVTSLVYDARGNVLFETNALGQVTSYAYGDPVNPDKQTSRTDALGQTTTWGYDARGNITVTRRPLSLFEEYQATYSPAGDKLTERTYDGEYSTWTYDERRRLIRRQVAGESPTDLTYSSDGLLVEESISEAGAVLPIFRTQWTHDAEGRVASVRRSDGFSAQTAYAANGRLLSAVLAGGPAYAFTYDASGVPTGETDPATNRTSSVREADGSLRYTDRLGNVRRTRIAADGKVERVTRPDGLSTVLEYDNERNLVSATDPAGNVSRWEFDELNRPVRFTDAAGAASTWAYDAVGNVVEMVNRNGQRRTFVYDANRRMTRERWHGPDGAVVREFVYAWSYGKLESVTDGLASWGFLGALPRPFSVRVTYPGQVARTISYGWNRNGVAGPGGAGNCCGNSEGTVGGSAAPTEITVTGGLDFFRINATYDGLALRRLVWSPPNDFFGGPDIQFVPDAVGRLAEVRRYRGALVSKSVYTWDPLGRVVGIAHRNAAGAPLHADAVLTLVRDAESRVIGINRASDVASYTYDVLSQVTGVTHSGGPAEAYAYDAMGVRTSSHRNAGPSNVGPGNRLESAGPLQFSYDAEGNVTQKVNTASGEVTRYLYDHRNQLTAASIHPGPAAPATATIEFGYDFAGRLISRRVDGGVRTWILYDRQMPVAEFADGADAVNAAFLYSPDRLDDVHAVWRAGVGTRDVLKDHLGTILGATDAQGALAWWTSYDLFGNLTGPAPAGGEPVRFTGRHFHDAFGLYEMRSRIYDPALGRFLQEDPLGFAANDMNLYRYVGNNPLNYTDPTGRNSALEYAMLLYGVTEIAYGAYNYADCLNQLLNYVNRALAGGYPGNLNTGCIGGGIPWPLGVQAGMIVYGWATGGPP